VTGVKVLPRINGIYGFDLSSVNPPAFSYFFKGHNYKKNGGGGYPGGFKT
jgi:hypothetical protein